MTNRPIETGLPAVYIHTSVCWWKWRRCLQGIAQRQSQRRTPESRMTAGSDGSATGTSSSARTDWTWPEPVSERRRFPMIHMNWKQIYKFLRGKNAHRFMYFIMLELYHHLLCVWWLYVSITYSFLPLHPDSEELDGSGPQVACSGVWQVARHWIQNSPQQHAVLREGIKQTQRLLDDMIQIPADKFKQMTLEQISDCGSCLSRASDWCHGLLVVAIFRTTIEDWVTYPYPIH